MHYSNLSIEDLRKTRLFHKVNPARLVAVEDHVAWLGALINNPCSVWEENGEMLIIEIKQLVERVDGITIEIYPNEHPPPHFHVWKFP